MFFTSLQIHFFKNHTCISFFYVKIISSLFSLTLQNQCGNFLEMFQAYFETFTFKRLGCYHTWGTVFLWFAWTSTNQQCDTLYFENGLLQFRKWPSQIWTNGLSVIWHHLKMHFDIRIFVAFTQINFYLILSVDGGAFLLCCNQYHCILYAQVCVSVILLRYFSKKMYRYTQFQNFSSAISQEIYELLNISIRWIYTLLFMTNLFLYVNVKILSPNISFTYYTIIGNIS